MGLKYTTLPYDEYFKNICNILFKYQYTVKNTSINEEIYKWIYEHSYGNISIIISLIHDAQEIAITSNVNKIDIKILNESYQSRAEMYHKFIQPTSNKVTIKKEKKFNKQTLQNSEDIIQDDITNQFNNIADILKASKENNTDFLDMLKQLISVEVIKL